MLIQVLSPSTSNNWIHLIGSNVNTSSRLALIGNTNNAKIISLFNEPFFLLLLQTCLLMLSYRAVSTCSDFSHDHLYSTIMAIWHHNMRAHLRQYWYRFLYKIPSYRHLKSQRALKRRQNARPKDRMPRTHHQNLSNVIIDTSLNAHCKLLNKLPLEIRQ